MTKPVLLIGPLAQAAVCDALDLSGDALTVPGQLLGADRRGLARDDWPVYRPADGQITAKAVLPSAALRRFAAVMGLSELQIGGHVALGAVERQMDGQADGPWQAGDQADLLAALAGMILDEPEDHAPDSIAARLPMMGVWASSCLRAATGPLSGGNIVAARGPDDIRITRREQPYAGYFAIRKWQLTHRTHEGGMTPPMTREGFVSGDAVVVLPYDPVRDRVLVIEQFRFVPVLRGDPQPWLLEPIAGRVDAGETVEVAALREAREEAALQIDRLIPGIHHYPSPGALGEFLYMFVGIADLPDNVTGVHGLDSEAEDIRGHLMSRRDLHDMVMAGQITNGPLSMLSLWLENRPDLTGSEPSG